MPTTTLAPLYPREKHNLTRQVFQPLTTIATRDRRGPFNSGKCAHGPFNRWTNKTDSETPIPNLPSQLSESGPQNSDQRLCCFSSRLTTWPSLNIPSISVASIPSCKRPKCHRTAVGRTWSSCRHSTRPMMQQISLFSSSQVCSAWWEKRKPDRRHLIETMARSPPLAQ
jgi:hypothetical protein